MGFFTTRAVLAVIAVAVAAAEISAQGPPRGGGGRARGGPGGLGRPAWANVNREKVAALNPVAKLRREANRLRLDSVQILQLDSVGVELDREVAVFLARIDSVTPLRRSQDDRGPPPGVRTLVDALAQIELRYQAGLQSALEVLNQQQDEKALELVAKEVDKMAEYTRAGPASLGRMGPPG